MISPILGRFVETYWRPLRPAITLATLSGLLAAVVLSAHLARRGTLEARAGAVLLIVIAFSASFVRFWVQRRSSSTDERVVRSILISTQRELGQRILRALRLSTRPATASQGESQELAKLHYERLLARASSTAVNKSAMERARRFTRFAVVAGAGALLGIFLSPIRVVEGLDVLAARQGVAPLEIKWLITPVVEAQPPSYLRRPPVRLSLESANVLPEGTQLTFHARPRYDGRTLIVTDGETEQEFVKDGSGALVAHWELQESGQLRVAARFGDVLIYEPRSIEVYSHPDQAPEVELSGAPQEYPLDQLERLELRWTAKDDHSLVQVDLVLRSAGKEERRMLERYPGDKRRASGGHVLFPDDSFLQRIFLPATIRIEARDNDPRQGNKWGQSAAITVRPPNVGAPQRERYLAMSKLRDELVDLLAQRRALDDLPPKERIEQQRELIEETSRLKSSSEHVLSTSYSGLDVPRGWYNFARAQLQRLETAYRTRRKEVEVTEEVLLAMDSALGSLASRDAQIVAKQLGDVADEAAFAARLSQGEAERTDGLERLQIAISVLDLGARELEKLGLLGEDLGSVALADLGRVRTSASREDFFHAELAALHMAARLHRPNPSFGSKGGGGGGVEAGPGMGGGQGSDAQGEASEADSEFDRMARELEELASEHGDAMQQTDGALQGAEEQLAREGLDEEARRRAEALRRSVMRLPQPGETPGTGRASAALSREHAGAMAHEMERLAFEEAVESGRRGLSAAQEALRKGGMGPLLERELEQAISELREQTEWAEQQLQQQNQAKEDAAKEALQQLSELEKDLAERARRLAQEKSGDARLPEEARQRLEEAQRLMENAARKLGEGEGNEGLNLQRQAQRLLEESKTGETDEGQSDSSNQSDADQNGGRRPAMGGDVPDPEEENRASDFRKRVLEGLSRRKAGRLAPAIQRYAEGLLR